MENLKSSWHLMIKLNNNNNRILNLEYYNKNYAKNVYANSTIPLFTLGTVLFFGTIKKNNRDLCANALLKSQIVFKNILSILDTLLTVIFELFPKTCFLIYVDDIIIISLCNFTFCS